MPQIQYSRYKHSYFFSDFTRHFLSMHAYFLIILWERPYVWYIVNPCMMMMCNVKDSAEICGNNIRAGIHNEFVIDCHITKHSQTQQLGIKTLISQKLQRARNPVVVQSHNSPRSCKQFASSSQLLTKRLSTSPHIPLHGTQPPPKNKPCGRQAGREQESKNSAQIS